MNRHTPGPWEVVNDEGTPFVYGPGHKLVPLETEDGKPGKMRSHLIALVYSDTPDGGSFEPKNQASNTHLIAAAPELLVALKDILAQVDHGDFQINGEKEARAALAKAEVSL